MPWESILGVVLSSLRALGVVMAMPVPTGRELPPTWRVAWSVLWGVTMGVASPALPDPHIGFGELGIAAMHEIMLGLALGFLVKCVFQMAAMAGRVIATEVGLVAAPGFDTPTPDKEPLPSFIMLFAGVMFFSTGAHHMVMAAFARSFEIAGPGMGTLASVAPMGLVGAVAQLVEVAVRMAAPFIALNFVIILSFSILGRAAPKMNVFVLSFSMRTLCGFLLLSGAGTLLARYLGMAFDDLPWSMLQLVTERS